MKVVFRVDAGPKVGSGHLKRCLVLANALFKSGARIHFISCEGIGHFSKEIKARNYSLTLLSNKSDSSGEKELQSVALQHDIFETKKAIRDWSDQVDWLIVDNYLLTEVWEKSLNMWVNNVCVIDDFVDRKHNCDLLINQSILESTNNVYDGLVPKSCKMLIGGNYALLDEEYSIKRKLPKKRKFSVKRVLVFFGSADRVNLTEKILKLISESLTEASLDDSIIFDIVTTSANNKHRLIQKLCSQYKFFNFHRDLPNLASLMWKADLVIGGGGSSCWERLCLSLPSFVITLADNQVEFAKMLANEKLITLVGHFNDFNNTEFKRNLTNILNLGVESMIPENCRNLIDGLGANRCTNILTQEIKEINIRYATPNDENKVLLLANDMLTRVNSFCTEVITRETHARIFQNRLLNFDHLKLFIFENKAGELLGQTRFEYENNCWKIDYSVSPLFRGFGYGKLILKLGIRRLASELGLICLLAEVKQSNLSSKKIFVGLGFDVLTAKDDVVVYSFKTGSN